MSNITLADIKKMQVELQESRKEDLRNLAQFTALFRIRVMPRVELPGEGNSRILILSQSEYDAMVEACKDA